MKFVIYINEKDFILLDKFINFVGEKQPPKFTLEKCGENNMMVILDKEKYYRLIDG
jgi:hypothetical protein